MDGIKMTSFTGADLFQALLGTMSNVLDMSFVARNVDEAFDFEKSIDVRVFSDFGIDGTEKDNRQEAIELNNQKILVQKEKEQSSDNLEQVADKVTEEAIEKRMEAMRMNGDLYIFGDYEFELEDAQANLRDKGVDHYTKDMNEEDAAEFALIAERIANGTATPKDMARAGELSSQFIIDNDQYYDVRMGNMADLQLSLETSNDIEAHRENMDELTKIGLKRDYGPNSEIAANFDNQVLPPQTDNAIEFKQTAPAFSPAGFG